MIWISVALGGALGSLARHAVNAAFSRGASAGSPYATATVNIIGSLVIGVLAGLIASQRLTMTPPVRAFVFVGILGGFTTFSSFMLDTLTLSHSTEHGLAVSNVLLQIALGSIAVFAGYAAAAR
jgi:CrcB protein